MNDLWFRPLVWTDYRLALLFTVIIPFILLIWSLLRRVEAIQRLLIIYWRVASLLMITVYLMISGLGIAYLTGFAAKVLIPLSLWFWVDLNDEIKDLPPSFLKFSLTSWRWAVTVYGSLGAVSMIPFLSCGFSGNLTEDPFCRVWLEAPWAYKALFHSNSTSGFLGFLGCLGLGIYILYFGSFLLFRLGKQGRSALEQ